MNLEFNHVPMEEPFLVPLKYIDVTRPCKKNVLMTLGKPIRTDVYQIRGTAFTKFTLPKEKPRKGYICVLGGGWQTFIRPPDVITCGQKNEKIVNRSESTKTGMENTRSFNSIMLDEQEEFTSWSWWQRLQRNFQKIEEQVGKTRGRDHAMRKESSNKHHEGGCKARNCTPCDSKKRLTDVKWNLLNP